jgi:AraC-like DNA-binding protein
MFPVVFGCPARFDADSYATVFPARMLHQPMRSPNAVLHGVLRRQAEREVAALPSRSALPFAVRDLLAVQLERGPELSEVARALGMSGSSLRARLREHGTTFSELLDDLRKEQARQLLAARELSVAEVSRALGFAHAPALQRACQRWFGQSPGAYRQAQRRHPVAELLGRGG